MANDEENSTDEGEGAEYFELCQLKQITPSDLDVRNLSAETALLADRWRLAAKAEADPATRERLMQMSQMLRAARNAFTNDQAWLKGKAGAANDFLESKNWARSQANEARGLRGAVLGVLKEWKKAGKPINDSLANELAAVIVHRLATVYSLLRSKQKVIPGWKLGVPNLPQDKAVELVAMKLGGTGGPLFKENVPLDTQDPDPILKAAMRAFGVPYEKAKEMFRADSKKQEREDAKH